jgi:hypothetical protein
MLSRLYAVSVLLLGLLPGLAQAQETQKEREAPRIAINRKCESAAEGGG